MNITAIVAAVAFAAGSAVAWNLQAHKITKMELTHAEQRISAARVARATIERTSNAVIAAQNAAAGRVAVLRRESAAARISADGLRDDLDTTQRAAASTIDACNRYSLAISKLLAASADANRKLAELSDGHVSDIRTLIDAWPR